MVSEAHEPEVPEAHATLLTITVVFRVVGLVWLVTLSTLSVLTGSVGAGSGRGLMVAAVVAASVWTLITVATWRIAPRVLTTWPWLAVDLLIGAGVAMVPQLTGANSFFVGGFPISSAILWATARGVAAGAIGGIVIALASARGYGTDQAARAAEVMAINSLAPVVIGWGFGSIRRNDARRRVAEAQLAAERDERARVVERAEVAAHLHDSVLQTLALIQRQADDRGEVLRLARSQERELRNWLNGVTDTDHRLMDAIRRAAGDVEERFGVVVDVSTVGETDLDRDVEAVAAATREAMINAAKFAGVQRVFVLAEARPHEVRVVIKDKGTGFDRATVAGDRRGLVDSIEGRMERHGGSATVWSKAGEGTEVDIRLPRASSEHGAPA